MTALTKSNSSPDPQDWKQRSELDALIAAPDHHELLFENDRVRVLVTRITPGDHTPVHIHQWPGVLHILSWSSIVRYSDTGEVLMDSRQVEALKAPPAVMWSPPLPPHYLENVGVTDLHIVMVELKE